MDVVNLNLSGLKLFKPQVFVDERGYVLESYQAGFYAMQGIAPFVQDNLSFSGQNVVRGLHFQEGVGQAKLISCMQGKIFDVAVDIRPASSTFGRFEAVILEGESHWQLYIPVGFAHGFCVLSETALVHYKVSAPYDAKMERSLRWNDPDIGIAWPILHPVLSMRDQTSPFLKEKYAI